ncbi:hypothetical protein DUI87_29912 [Hirundo rustica rustica]|uniref:Integrase zinc-binding domain-containing protein n=1 Tax=Hirundo rustica rustica TaxID=333673 RepID=A0A3M0IYZ3_HIRRU|nr:hypothetical protein DUI87_29912 [Hirundo rustica rustica]
MDNISQVIHNCETCAAIKQAKRVKPLWYGGRWKYSLIYLPVVSVLLISPTLGDMGIYMTDFDSYPHRALATIHESV